MVGFCDVQVAVAVIFRMVGKFLRCRFSNLRGECHYRLAVRFDADLCNRRPDPGTVFLDGLAVDLYDLQVLEVLADPVVKLVSYIHRERHITGVGDVYVICHGIAAVEAVHSALTLFRCFSGPGLIHGIGRILPIFIRLLDRRVRRILLVAQLIRVIFLGYGLFGDCVTLTVPVLILTAVLSVGSNHIRGTGGVQVSKAIINGVSGEEFSCCIQYISLISDDCIASDCQLQLYLVAFHADDAAHGSTFTAVLIIEPYSRCLRCTEVPGDLEVIRHGHGQVGLSRIGHGHVIQHPVSAEESVFTGPGFCRCQ